MSAIRRDASVRGRERRARLPDSAPAAIGGLSLRNASEAGESRSDSPPQTRKASMLAAITTIAAALALPAASEDAVVFHPEDLALTAIGDGLPATLMPLGVEGMRLLKRRPEQGGVHYYFVDPDAPYRNASLLLRDGRLVGSVWDGKTAKAIGPVAPGMSTISTEDTKDFPGCGFGEVAPPPEEPTAELALPAVPCDDGSTLDMLFVCTASGYQSAGGEQALLDLIAFAVADMNLAFSNNGIPLRARVVDIMLMPEFTGAGPDPCGLVIQAQNGGIPGVRERRDQVDADLVSVISGVGPVAAGCVTSLPASISTSQSFRGYNAVAGSYLAFRVLTHEVGHNFGACHVPGDGGGCEAGGIFAYSNAHRFVGRNGTLYGTALSYQGAILPLFSTPLLTVDGQPAGIAGERDNARTVEELRMAVTNYRCDDEGNCGTGGNCYEAQPLNAVGCANADCCASVCATDPSCCTERWDADCAAAAVAACTACGGAGTGACDMPHATPSCDDAECCAKVCSVDPLCCDVSWDATCAQSAIVRCAPQCGDIDAGNCFAAHAGHSCLDFDCCRGVCFLDPTCCTESWDASCVQAALTNPDCAGTCGAPGTGACDQPHQTPSCNDPECCALVCRVDPGCCEFSWDFSCVKNATYWCSEAFCGAPFLPPCQFFHARPFCSDASCCERVCAVQPTCCQTEWDQSCAQSASVLCPTCGSPGAGSCTEVHAGPFCSNESCCFQACSIDPTCCSDSWDQGCVDIAVASRCDNLLCRNVVCFLHSPDCCNFTWDSACDGLAADYCPGPCRADLDRNGRVDGADLGIMLSAWGFDENFVADQDYDAFVDGNDLGLLLGAWGQACN